MGDSCDAVSHGAARFPLFDGRKKDIENSAHTFGSQNHLSPKAKAVFEERG